MKVLAIGAHPDDVELGAGATLAEHAAAGDEVSILVLSAGVTSRGGDDSEAQKAIRQQAIEAAKILGAQVCVLNNPDQRFDTVARLDIVRAIEAAIRQVQPERVYTHHGGDRNLDHRITHDAVLTACRPVPGSCVESIYAFEVASSSEWGTVFWPTAFVDVSGEPLAKKGRALVCYAAEMRASPHPRSLEALAALARWRGATVGVEAAEAFEVVREML